MDHPLVFGLKTFENDLICCDPNGLIFTFTSKRQARLKNIGDFIEITRIDLFPTVINTMIEDYCGKYTRKEWIQDWLLEQKIHFTFIK